jgi:hypothetical protein
MYERYILFFISVIKKRHPLAGCVDFEVAWFKTDAEKWLHILRPCVAIDLYMFFCRVSWLSSILLYAGPWELPLLAKKMDSRNFSLDSSIWACMEANKSTEKKCYHWCVMRLLDAYKISTSLPCFDLIYRTTSGEWFGHQNWKLSIYNGFCRHPSSMKI